MNKDTFFDHVLKARFNFRDFVLSCQISDSSFQLTRNSEASPYALCFSIFSLHLIGDTTSLNSYKNIWNTQLRTNIHDFYERRHLIHDLTYDKPFLQLLTFTISCLSILGTLDQPLNFDISRFVPSNATDAFKTVGALTGRPRSGNFAMFWAIIALYTQHFNPLQMHKFIDDWKYLHLSARNSLCFWSNSFHSSPSYLQFQNGYHQYEIFSFLSYDQIDWDILALNVSRFRDSQGHYAPYPGGGGCFDYDAIFFLTSSPLFTKFSCDSLLLTASSILNSQNDDGGFCESLHVRPRSPKNIIRMLSYPFTYPRPGFVERFRLNLTLLRNKHSRIHTHWSTYSRYWFESDLWDSWFRMLALARIQVSLYPETFSTWGFINFPGIGYHHLLKS